jgi:hypothetical protein
MEMIVRKLTLLPICLVLAPIVLSKGQASDPRRPHVSGAPQFRVVGEANKPGEFEFKEGMTFRQAAILFEGVTPKASISRIVILRKNQLTGAISKIPIDFGGVMEGIKDDITILVDDIIVIPEFGVNRNGFQNVP